MSNRKIYRKIAKENGVSVAEVKADMQAALNTAWNNPDKTPEQASMQNRFSSDGTTPTVDEFLTAAKSQLKKKS